VGSTACLGYTHRSGSRLPVFLLEAATSAKGPGLRSGNKRWVAKDQGDQGFNGFLLDQFVGK
jgi:hypothetical protein